MVIVNGDDDIAGLALCKLVEDFQLDDDDVNHGKSQDENTSLRAVHHTRT